MKDLVDEEGENQAVRCFLMAYGTAGLTVNSMIFHMSMCGFDATTPDWARTTEVSHLTKSGAQMWLRHLFSLEPVKRETPPDTFIFHCLLEAAEQEPFATPKLVNAVRSARMSEFAARATMVEEVPNLAAKQTLLIEGDIA